MKKGLRAAGGFAYVNVVGVCDGVVGGAPVYRIGVEHS
jgi:hypothetical protein